MKIKLTLTSLLLLAVATPAFCVSEESTAGKVGNVTLVLVSTYEQGAFKDEEGNPTACKETITATQDKHESRYVIKKVRYTNKTFLADLVTKGTLSAPSTDWSIKYVQAEAISSIEGIYAVKKSGEIVYLGGYCAGEQFPISLQAGDGYASNYRETEIRTYKSTEKSEANLKTYSLTETWNEVFTVFLTLRPTASCNALYAAGLAHASGSYSERYTAATDREVSTYHVPASSVTNIIGESEENESILQGTIKISAQANVADVTAYIAAYQAVNPPL